MRRASINTNNVFDEFDDSRELAPLRDSYQDQMVQEERVGLLGYARSLTNTGRQVAETPQGRGRGGTTGQSLSSRRRDRMLQGQPPMPKFTYENLADSAD